MISERWNRTVGDCLGRLDPPADVLGWGHWSFCTRLSRQHCLDVEARLDDGWLLLGSPLPGPPPVHNRASASTWLASNRSLAGLAKFALTEPSGDLVLRAEIPLTEPIEVEGALRWTCDGLRQGLSAWVKGAAMPTQPALPASPLGLADVGELSVAAGWDVVARGDDELVVSLLTGSDFQQARMRVGVCPVLRVEVVVDTAEDLGDRERLALGSLLLVAGGVSRMTRVSTDTECPRFEICFDEAPSSAQLDRALTALSVACLLFSREAQAIQDPRVARLFLARDGLARDGLARDGVAEAGDIRSRESDSRKTRSRKTESRKTRSEKNRKTGGAYGRKTA